MNDRIQQIMSKMEFNNPTNVSELEKVEKNYNIDFPDDYKKFILASNGAEGSIGNNKYLVLYPIDELIEINNEYEVEKNQPGLIYFGSDGGDTSYAFDTTDKMSLVSIPFICIHTEEKEKLGNNFEEFIENLNK